MTCLEFADETQAVMNMREKNKRTREAIISAAMQLLCTTDYDQVTVRAIAEEANVSPSNIYKYFENKDELMVALYGDIVGDMINKLNSSVKGVRDTHTKIYKITAFYTYYYQENRHIAMIMYPRKILRNLIESEEAFQDARLFGTVFIKILEDGQARGEVRKDIDMRLMNWIYHGGIRQMTLGWLYRPDSFNLTDAAEGYAKAIYAAVKCPEPAAFVCPYYKDESSKSKRAKAKSKRL